MLRRNLTVNTNGSRTFTLIGNAGTFSHTENNASWFSEETIWNYMETEYLMNVQMKTYVFAMNFGHFVYWCQKENINYYSIDVVYVRSVQYLMGISTQSQFIFLQGWQSNYDVQYVLDMMSSFQAIAGQPEVSTIKPDVSNTSKIWNTSPTGRIKRR